MPDKSHVSILRQGTDVWNCWRSQNPLIQPDLTQAIFRGKFSGVNLSSAFLGQLDFGESDLSAANFSQAYLNWAQLRKTKLIGASFYSTSLVGANLRDADLTGADLRHADLRYADLCYANLSGANLSQASLLDCKVHKTDFSQAILEDTKMEKSLRDFLHKENIIDELLLKYFTENVAID